MNFIDTVKGSYLENFYPEGWDFKKIDACCSHSPEEITTKQDFWNNAFNPVECNNIYSFNMMLGHEIALEIRKSKGAYERNMQWQGMSLWMTLRYEPCTWVTSSFMPTLPGKLFYLKGLAGPLNSECN